ncbi:CS1 type fimbrial major subunit [Pseudomonas eucalypticola]|uniref:Adhesin n=1 Tax=Pseudomonas eucalypticola TaxID=2599595 RepID=A0A7D5HUS4_9PSED|nr:CS1 type fimbrial major subunit [Pseudomonas eucalypticola]QKZ03191.1 adhesin [Pseudomonas eucalypticola]
MKRSLLALPLALLVAGSAFAAQRIDHTVTVTATIPTDTFYVEPLGGNWMNDPQNMSFRPADGGLEPIHKQLSVKSSTGAIQAKVLNQASMTSGTNSIPLTVSVGGKNLTLAGQDVVAAADASAGTVVDFRVTAGAKPGTGYVAGNYQGIVNVVFETPDP